MIVIGFATKDSKEAFGAAGACGVRVSGMNDVDGGVMLRLFWGYESEDPFMVGINDGVAGGGDGDGS